MKANLKDFISDLNVPSRHKIINKQDLLEPLKMEVAGNDYQFNDMIDFYHLISERGKDDKPTARSLKCIPYFKDLESSKLIYD